MHVAEKKLLPAEIEPIIMAHSEQGTLPADIISFSRRQGLLAVAVNDMSDIVREIDNGYPVIVLQNLGFEFAPKWHYALVVGYDLEKQLLILHSGENEYTEMPMTYFERHWQFAKHWGLVILPPVQLSASGGEIKHLQAAVGLENAGQLDAASSAYLAIYKRWPKSLAALIGLGNVYYKGKKFDKSENYLEKALILDPQSKVAQHNLSLVRKKLFKR